MNRLSRGGKQDERTFLWIYSVVVEQFSDFSTIDIARELHRISDNWLFLSIGRSRRNVSYYITWLGRGVLSNHYWYFLLMSAVQYVQMWRHGLTLPGKASAQCCTKISNRETTRLNAWVAISVDPKIRSSISALNVRACPSIVNRTIGDLHGEVLEPEQSLAIMVGDENTVHSTYSRLHPIHQSFILATEQGMYDHLSIPARTMS